MTTQAASPTTLEDFVTLSSILTGIAPDKLHPDLDTHQTAATYLATATARGGDDFAKVMAIYAANRSQPPAAIAALILNGPPEVGYMARAVMLMWYLGAWYDPAALAAYAGRWASNPTPPASVVISSDTYTQGWAWRVAQAHPMGFNEIRLQQGFGYWRAAPPKLADFVGA